ncbi:MAG: GNAT family N-acetyltransferase [Amphiplicatus sp.]
MAARPRRGLSIMETGRIFGVGDFEREISPLWGAPRPQRPTPMLHEAWIRACARALNPDGAFEIIAAERACAVFERRRAVFPCLFLLGAEELWEPADVLYEDERGAARLAAAVVKRGLPARFGHFPADSAFVVALKEICRGKAFLLADPVAGSPCLTLHEGWREPESQFNSRRKSDFRRMRRKAEAMGAVTMEFLSPNAEEAGALIEEAIAVEAGGWKAKAGSALLFDAKALAFFRLYARLAGEAGLLRLSFLRIDGKAAAAQIAVEYENALWLLKIGYDDAYKDCSPGNLLLLETVRRAAKQGLLAVEFLGKSAPWTALWTKQERANIRLRVYPFNAPGAAAFVFDAGAAGYRRIRAKFGSNTLESNTRKDDAESA